MCSRSLPAVIIGGVIGVVSLSAFAVDTGTVTFSGKIIPDTCKVNVNGVQTNGTVTFNDLSQTAFSGDDSVGDTQPLTITLSECDESLGNLNIKFEGQRVAGKSDEVLQTTGGAANLGIRLYQEGGVVPVKFDGSEPDDATNKANGTSVAFSYQAKVVQVGTTQPTSGSYTAQATYTLLYR